ncbi:UDP-4-amino-4,6-dideoxy-N-acetyl-beta-L-altrosamine transaminase [Desulforamulus aquiferis]|uniref:UDP-4-amino-4, 6-dideoxy-N-acetyl-beta-L-altrosamine transaminase n=1 Tax=Desulforamulus aquiferis TaxID=1397668 RepID=A0AAW7ZF22_9FIRM|nr:UDP-4-amino-4,6-dideoxy-N-acetyl-beta-L-altrosamine transaminase [Desulforamulus aquiferis]MDO7788348.1 UDP-4-amino-4,6-dideoxy-N-acetyl-beta-L-altrosamine transaminase [Desulforamulus aquiferis]
MLKIPYGKQNINEEDIKAVVEVLRSDWLTQGPMIERFEKTVAEYCGAKFAVAVSNATAALHIACLAVGLKSGDILWTSPNTFVASSNCGLYCGASVDFVDIDPKTYNMSLQALQEKLDLASSMGKLPQILIPVHFAGQACEMEKIANLVKPYGITIIEDASHAIGGEYKGKKIGSCAISDMTVFSFHPVKIITTGEGGMILTNREDLYKILIRLRTHGITRDPLFMDGESHGPWYYQQVDLGFNYRITDLQAALGVSQMKRLDEFIQRRHWLAQRYNNLLQDLPLTTPWQHPDTYSAYHLYVIKLKLEELSKTHKTVFEEIRSAGINANLHYIPVHTQPYYKKLGFKIGDFPEAEKYYRQAISLPLYYSLSEQEQDYVIQVLKEVLQ